MFSTASNLQKVENIQKTVFRFIFYDLWNWYLYPYRNPGVVLLVMLEKYGTNIYCTHSPYISVQNYKQIQPGFYEVSFKLDETKLQIR